jgi:hypothetical protein
MRFPETRWGVGLLFLLISSDAARAFGGPGDPGGRAFSCPYAEKSEDAAQLLDQAKASINGAIAQLQKKGEECRVQMDQIQTLQSSFNAALEKLKDARFPEERNYGADFSVGGAPFVCSADRTPLYQFISQYTDDRIGQIHGGSRTRSALAGELGEALENAISDCTRQNGASPDKARDCVYSTMKFNPGLSANPGSLIDTVYRRNCIGDAATRTEAEYRKRAEEMARKKSNFEEAMRTISVSSTQLSTMIMSTGESPAACQALKTSMSSALFTGLNLASTISGPWGALGASIMAPMVSAAVNNLGTNAGRIKELEKVRSALEVDEREELMEKLSCNLFQANKMRCELLRRTERRSKEQVSCEKPAEKNLKEAISLVRAWEDRSRGTEGGFSTEDAQKLYTDFFDPGLQKPDGSRISRYDYLFGEEGVLKQTQKKLSASTSLEERRVALEMVQFQGNLEGFKKEYAQALDARSLERMETLSFQKGAEALKFVQGGAYSAALMRFLALRNQEQVSSAPDGLSSALAADLQNHILNQAITLNRDIPENMNESSDLAMGLDRLYENFLGGDTPVRTDYILKPSMDRVARLKKDFLASEAFGENGRLKNPAG